MENWIIALATVGTLIYPGVSYRLNKTIKEKDDRFRELIQERDQEFRQQVMDLYTAITISNLIHPPQNNTSQAIKHFRELYKGKPPIFEGPKEAASPSA